MERPLSPRIQTRLSETRWRNDRPSGRPAITDATRGRLEEWRFSLRRRKERAYGDRTSNQEGVFITEGQGRTIEITEKARFSALRARRLSNSARSVMTCLLDELRR